MNRKKPKGQDGGIGRRDFLVTSAVAGAGLVLAPTAFAKDKPKATKKEKVDELNVAIIGPGHEGRMLMMNCLKIPGIRFRAVCEIWPYHQRYAANILKKYNQAVNVYTDYREMLVKEKDLQAVIVATPDWMHAEQTIACLNAKLHVYCEKEMSNTLAGAKQMVLAAKKTGRLLQIGHQRRSNPRYLLANKIIHKDKVLGRITHIEGQWNRASLLDRRPPKVKAGDAARAKRLLIDKAGLKKYGYDTMERLTNWRWFRKFSGGPIADLGSHQVDIFNWFLKAQPTSVFASGGVDYYKGPEWYDNVTAIYQYTVAGHPVRGTYGVYNTTSHGGYFETFMGDEGSLVISEDSSKGFIFREARAKKREWENAAEKVESMGRKAIELKVGESLKGGGKKDGEALNKKDGKKRKPPKPIHMYHLENFFDAIRKGTPLNCPPEVAYETAVSVFAVNESMKKGARVDLKPGDFKVRTKPPKSD